MKGYTRESSLDESTFAREREELVFQCKKLRFNLIYNKIEGGMIKVELDIPSPLEVRGLWLE